jgi:hypothetical protein
VVAGRKWKEGREEGRKEGRKDGRKGRAGREGRRQNRRASFGPPTTRWSAICPFRFEKDNSYGAIERNRIEIVVPMRERKQQKHTQSSCPLLAFFDLSWAGAF